MIKELPEQLRAEELLLNKLYCHGCHKEIISEPITENTPALKAKPLTILYVGEEEYEICYGCYIMEMGKMPLEQTLNLVRNTSVYKGMPKSVKQSMAYGGGVILPYKKTKNSNTLRGVGVTITTNSTNTNWLSTAAQVSNTPGPASIEIHTNINKALKENL